MRSHITNRFRSAFKRLPKEIQNRAREAYVLFKQNNYHPSLRYKQIHPTKPIYSIRISVDYRALGIREGEEIIWFWIGSHEEYDKLISKF